MKGAVQRFRDTWMGTKAYGVNGIRYRSSFSRRRDMVRGEMFRSFAALVLLFPDIFMASRMSLLMNLLRN